MLLDKQKYHLAFFLIQLAKALAYSDRRLINRPIDDIARAARCIAEGKLPILVSSGFGDALVSSQLAREEVAGLVSKPYNLEQLREVLRRVLDEGGTTLSVR